MKVVGIILLALLALSLLPLGVRVKYSEEGFFAFVRLWFIRWQVFPAKAKKTKEKPPKKPKGEKATEKTAQEAKAGGKLDLVRAALPLVKPALVGVKKRLTIRELELFVTWAAGDPADAAMGYGYAQAALGTLWAVADQNFKVKKSRLGCSVNFDAPSPTVYADAALTVRLGQVVTLVIPLIVRFLSNSARVKRETAEKTKKEA